MLWKDNTFLIVFPSGSRLYTIQQIHRFGKISSQLPNFNPVSGINWRRLNIRRSKAPAFHYTNCPVMISTNCSVLSILKVDAFDLFAILTCGTPVLVILWSIVLYWWCSKIWSVPQASIALSSIEGIERIEGSLTTYRNSFALRFYIYMTRFPTKNLLIASLHNHVGTAYHLSFRLTVYEKVAELAG